MQFFYTGAEFFNAVQNNIDKSLGGYMSSSLVPSRSFNNLFSDISKTDKEQGTIETKAIVLKNTTGLTVSSLYLYQNYPTGGSNYTIPPNVTIQGDGTGAIATATISGGKIVSFNVVDGGTGYTFAKVILSGGDGVGGNGISNISIGIINSIDVGSDALVKLEWAAVTLVGQQKMEKISNFRSTPYVGTFNEPNGISNKILLSNSFAANDVIGLWLRRTVTLPDPDNIVTTDKLEAYLKSLSKKEEIEVVLNFS